MATSNYSIDMLKKAAFVDELNNVLRVSNPIIDTNKSVVMKYLMDRIAEIDFKYKK